MVLIIHNVLTLASIKISVLTIAFSINNNYNHHKQNYNRRNNHKHVNTATITNIRNTGRTVLSTFPNKKHTFKNKNKDAQIQPLQRN